MSRNRDVDRIAIIGMAGRFPGAPDVDTLWSNLCRGVESIQSFSDEELRAAGAHPDEPGFVNSGGPLDDVEAFDAAFFGMSRREAEITDPQHRVVLETAWAALEHAGCDPGAGGRRIGIFGGVARNLYFRHNLLAHQDLLARMGDYTVLLATEREYAITRAAYKLGLEGPALSVNTACSTSAVAVHLAVQSLLAGESDIALAGGAHILLPATGGYIYQEGGIASADGHVRAFDAAAQGTLMTSGVAFVALKRLTDALEDADTVYAVILGSAVNNDGGARIGFTAPSVQGQRAVIEDALAVADVDADSIGMLEAHGTGTSLGDPIEVEALCQAYRASTSRRQYCALGSLKSNIGHLDAAAGAAGIIKAALSLYHERIPPSINYTTANPQIDFVSSPFFVNTELREWRRTDVARRAGISSFGFGGTNAHIVLEEAPPPTSEPVAGPLPHILVLSAKTPAALGARRTMLADHLVMHPDIHLADASYTLALGRSPMAYRSAVVADDVAASAELLRRADRPRRAVGTDGGTAVVLLFTGQGAQYAGMGAGLYQHEPVFAAAMRECADIVGDIDGHGLLELVLSERADRAANDERVLETAVGQPAIFTIQYALARLWASWGIEPAVMVGHSIGEVAAACVGGVFSLDDALRIAVARGRLMQSLPAGAMTAVLAEEAAVCPFLDDETSLAAANAPEQCVASGPRPSIEELERQLQARGIAYRRLVCGRAFHSPMMDPVIEPLEELVARTVRSDLRVPMVSTVTGTWTNSAEIRDPAYWGLHARRKVRFSDAIGVLLAELPGSILLEIGPGSTLASLVRQHPGLTSDNTVVSSLPSPGADRSDAVQIREALAHAWTAGAGVDWPAVLGGPRRRIPLPTYPFARERFWIEGSVESPADTATMAPQPPASASTFPQVPEGRVTTQTAGDATSPRMEHTAAQIASTFADLSGVDAAAIDPTTTFTELGFDSLFLTQANSQFRKLFGVRVTLRQLLCEMPTIERLAAHIDAELSSVTMPAALPEADRSARLERDSPGATPVPILTNVVRYLGERDTPHPEHWNLGVLLIPQRRLTAAITRSVVATLIERHDALRLRFHREGSGWASTIAAPTAPPPFASCDLSSLSEAEQTAAIEQRCTHVQQSLLLEQGPLIRVELFDLGDRGQRLLVVVHHFVMDQMSWPPFWEDFEALYEALEGGAEISLPPVATTFEHWARALKQHADSSELRAQAGAWLDLPWEQVRPIPLDHPNGANTNASAAQVQVFLTPAETTALFRQTRGIARKADLVLIALARTLAIWSTSDTVLIDMMGHGRDDEIVRGVDPLETVGFFISYTPLVLRIPESAAQWQTPPLEEQIESLLRVGLGYDLLRTMCSDTTVRQAFQNLPHAQILFNHHGQRDEPDEVPRSSLFRAAAEPIGPTHCPEGLRYYPIAVSSEISHGRLCLNFVYSANLHERATIEGLTVEFQRQLATTVAGAT